MRNTGDEEPLRSLREPMLRVAHVIGGLGIGGAERHLVNLVNSMSCEFRAVILIGEKRNAESFRDQLDSQVVQFDVPVRGRNLPIGLFRLSSILRGERINVLHTHMFHPNLLGGLAAKLAGVPVVVTTEHGENPWKRALHRLLERRVISKIADVRFCVSPEILAIRRDLDGVPASKLRVVVNGTSLPPLAPRSATESTMRIGAVGRFIPAKDLQNFVEAISRLRNLGYDFNASLVGDGPDMPAVRARIEELQLTDIVELPGFSTNVDGWYRRFDVFVSSSIREGQPVALLEAMAHRVPVVATDVGASGETVQHNVGGLIVPPSDPAALAEALAKLLDDPELRVRFGENARRRVEEHYSATAVAKFHEATYHELLEQKGLDGESSD